MFVFNDYIIGVIRANFMMRDCGGLSVVLLGRSVIELAPADLGSRKGRHGRKAAGGH